MDINVSMGDGRTKEEQEAHDAAMIAKAEEGASTISVSDGRTGQEDQNIELGTVPQSEEAAANKRPDDIPEKFWDADKGEVNVAALLKAQQDAEAALRQQQNTPDKKKEEDSAGAPEGTTESQTSVVEAASAEFAKDGQLSEDTYAALEKVGITREMTDGHIAGVESLTAGLKAAAYDTFDGQEGFDKAAEWAAVNLSDDEIAALDVQLTSSNPAIVRAGSKALAERFAEANPDEGTTLRGDSAATNMGGYFKSGAEMREAMADPRYRKDSAFREEVAQKIARADKAGVNLFG
jgi:hypothetical protein